MTYSLPRYRTIPLRLLAAFAVALPLSATNCASTAGTAVAAAPAQVTLPTVRDGLHDFDFVIGDWQVHLKKLLNPLTGSTNWVEYTGTSKMRKILDGRGNLEEFEVDSPANHLHIQAQTLRLYNPDSHQWAIYLLDAAKGKLGLPPTVGAFTNGVGELYDYEDFGGHWILVRFMWFNISPQEARMEQSFSADGGKTWEVNWICELSRDKA